MASVESAEILPAPTFWIWRIAPSVPPPKETTPLLFCWTPLVPTSVLPIFNAVNACAVPVTELEPMATSCWFVASALTPMAVPLFPAFVCAPSAVPNSADTLVSEPIATAFCPFAFAFVPIAIVLLPLAFAVPLPTFAPIIMAPFSSATAPEPIASACVPSIAIGTLLAPPGVAVTA